MKRCCDHHGSLYGSKQAGVEDGAVAEHLDLIHKSEVERALAGNGMGF